MKVFGKIDPDEYEVVVCINGRGGRLFEYGKETTAYVQKIGLTHEAGSRAELTVKRHVVSKDVMEHLDSE